MRLRQRVLNAIVDDKVDQFQPIFLTETERELEKQKEVAVENENKSIFNSLPTMDDDEIVEFVSKELTGKFLESKIFRTGIMAVIVTNSLMIAIETDKKLVSLNILFDIDRFLCISQNRCLTLWYEYL